MWIFIKIGIASWAVEPTQTQILTHTHTHTRTYRHPRVDSNIFSQNLKRDTVLHIFDYLTLTFCKKTTTVIERVNVTTALFVIYFAVLSLLPFTYHFFSNWHFLFVNVCNCMWLQTQLKKKCHARTVMFVTFITAKSEKNNIFKWPTFRVCSYHNNHFSG